MKRRRFKNPDKMSREEVVAEVADIQQEVRLLGKRLHELAHDIHLRARRSPVDDTTSAYLNFSGINVRLAGTLEQVMRRSERVSKTLGRTLENAQENASREQQRQRPPTRKPVVDTLSPMESLINLYSSEPASGLPTGDS